MEADVQGLPASEKSNQSLGPESDAEGFNLESLFPAEEDSDEQSHRQTETEVQELLAPGESDQELNPDLDQQSDQHLGSPERDEVEALSPREPEPQVGVDEKPLEPLEGRPDANEAGSCTGLSLEDPAIEKELPTSIEQEDGNPLGYPDDSLYEEEATDMPERMSQDSPPEPLTSTPEPSTQGQSMEPEPNKGPGETEPAPSYGESEVSWDLPSEGDGSLSSGNTTASDEREALEDVTFDSEEEVDRENIEIGGEDPTLQEAEREQQHPRDKYDLRSDPNPTVRFGDRAHSLRDVGAKGKPNPGPKPDQGQKGERGKKQERGNSESPLFSKIVRAIRWVRGNHPRPGNP